MSITWGPDQPTETTPSNKKKLIAQLLAAAKFARSVMVSNGIFELSERLAVEKLEAAIAAAERTK